MEGRWKLFNFFFLFLPLSFFFLFFLQLFLKGISWQRGIFADKFFPFPGKVGKIVEDSFPFFFFLLYFILSPIPSAKTRNFYSIPLLDEWTTVTRFIPWWKDSQLKSLGIAVVQRIQGCGEGRKFRVLY